MWNKKSSTLLWINCTLPWKSASCTPGWSELCRKLHTFYKSVHTYEEELLLQVSAVLNILVLQTRFPHSYNYAFIHSPKAISSALHQFMQPGQTCADNLQASLKLT